MPPADPVPVLLDVDTGVDDALAILLAARHPRLDVRAITCVDGNTGVEHAVRNTLAVLEAAGAQEVPVARGAARPLIAAQLWRQWSTPATPTRTQSTDAGPPATSQRRRLTTGARCRCATEPRADLPGFEPGPCSPTAPLPSTPSRHDRVDKAGSVTMRHNGRLHHIGVGRTHAGTCVVLLVGIAPRFDHERDQSASRAGPNT